MSNLPVYYMSLYKILVGVNERLDCISRNFSWDGNSVKRKLLLMKWSNVMKAKALSGQGLGCFALKDRALLANWWWRFGVEMEALWRRIVVAKFGEGQRRWVPRRVPRFKRSGCWGVISCLGDVVYSKGVDFRVGNGSRVQF